jgi:hypothetical protein
MRQSSTSPVIIEVATVTDEELERVVNEWVGKGWAFDGISSRCASRRGGRRWRS